MPTSSDHRLALGLPPGPIGSAGRLSLLVGALAVLLVAGFGGWLAGSLRLAGRMRAMSVLFVELQDAHIVGGVRDCLDRMARNRAGLGREPAGRLLMAMGYAAAAEYFPAKEPYLRQAMVELDVCGNALEKNENPGLRLMYADLRSQVLMELGRDREALRELRFVEDRLRENAGMLNGPELLQHKNNLAYLLASSRDAAVRDPEKALRLAKEVVGSTVILPDGRRPSRVAAYLDTLAEAYFASGNAAQALVVQRTALCLAHSHGLHEYLRHFDKYAGKK